MRDNILLPDGTLLHLPVKPVPFEDGEDAAAEAHGSSANTKESESGDKGFALLEKARTGAGSTAAAGSDFFHIYRKQRAREMARLEKLEEEGREEEFDQAHHDHREKRIRDALNKTAKKAEKRRRAKAVRRRGGGNAPAPELSMKAE